MSPSRLTYRFGPLEQRGILGALRLVQVCVVTFGVIAAIAIMDLTGSAGGALAGLIVFAGATATAVVPIGRRTIAEWAPVAVAHLVRRARRVDRSRSSAPARGMIARLSPARTGGIRIAPAPAEPPPALAGVRIAELAYRDRQIGALSELRGRRLTAVLACRVTGFSLLEAEAQERRLSRWGLVLSGAAATPVRRIQWLERTAPAQGDQLARWLHAERDPAIPLRGTPMIESYLELIGTTARVTQEHEILVAVQVDARRLRDRGAEALPRALVEQTERVAQGLEAAEVSVVGALSCGQLARVLRTAFDPYARAELAELAAADPGRQGLSEASAWPVGAHAGWERYRSDGARHTTFWIGGWPRVDVSPMFMDALLGRSSAVRTAAVTFEPLPAERSTREVEASITRDRADRELRARFGQSETARQRQAMEATLRREAELAAGHAEVRLAGYVTVTGRDQDELRQACSEVAEHAARARLELHCMYGQQAESFTFTLPLCRGLR